MKAVAQRVASAVCMADGVETGRIAHGLLVFLGVARDDTVKDADYLVNKIVNLRVFPDENDKMNFSVKDRGFGLLVISQFTLLADCRKGNRPNFMNAAPAEEGERLYEYFMTRAAEHVPVARGLFGAMMDITAVNAGPVTIILESK